MRKKMVKLSLWLLSSSLVLFAYLITCLLPDRDPPLVNQWGKKIITIGYSQWRSQDEQVTWAQHEHIQCARNMRELGHALAMKVLHSEIASEAVFDHKYHSFSLTVCSLHVHMKATAHANNRSLTLALHNFIFNFFIIFIPDTIEFYVGTGRGMPWCSYAKPVLSSPESYSGICNYIFIGASLGDPQIINVPSAVCMPVVAMHLYVVP